MLFACCCFAKSCLKVWRKYSQTSIVYALTSSLFRPEVDTPSVLGQRETQRLSWTISRRSLDGANSSNKWKCLVCGLYGAVRCLDSFIYSVKLSFSCIQTESMLLNLEDRHISYNIFRQCFLLQSIFFLHGFFIYIPSGGKLYLDCAKCTKM